MLKIGVGILACNEAENIETILDNVFSQSIFQASGEQYDIEVVVVPNGCSDNTAELARKRLEGLAEEDFVSPVSWKVTELTKGDKAGAWNHFIHSASRPDTDYYILVDADIEIVVDRTFERLIDGLVNNSSAKISYGNSVKHSMLKGNKTLYDRVSLFLAGGIKESGVAHKASRADDKIYYMSGQLYGARASALKRIWMPSGLPAEDGFLATCITTNMFKSEMAGDQIIRVADALHKFVAESTVKGWLHHEKRMTIGAAINGVLKKYFEARRDSIPDVGQWIREQGENDPNWLARIMDEAVKDGSGFVSFSWGIRRIRELKKVRPLKAMAFFPVYTAFLPVDFYVRHKSNKTISARSGVGFW
ncbi:MAG: glycosyltransferase family 2 protein [Deltaproteobacteria bacterium]|nr:glycosyltransferase family 2 protein [Deltaproteobacteria bacterium]